MDANKLHYLHQMGIQPWQLKQKMGAVTTCLTPSLSNGGELGDILVGCTVYGLPKTPTQATLAADHPQPKLLIIRVIQHGLHGQTAGRAEPLLTAMLQTIGLEKVSDEITPGAHALQEQVSLINPKVILAVGVTAAQQLLQTDATLDTLRGKTHAVFNKPVIVTYHPADLLRNPADKRHALHDLHEVQQAMMAMQ